jgi:large subunit ribosomal protein L21e
MKVTPFVEEFEMGEKVIIDQNPCSQSNMPHFRFKGKVGVVSDKRGRAFVVSVKDGNKPKTVITGPEHLRHWSKL